MREAGSSEKLPPTRPPALRAPASDHPQLTCWLARPQAAERKQGVVGVVALPGNDRGARPEGASSKP
jgi:hypothetical protein